jgi:hypothetical protein
MPYFDQNRETRKVELSDGYWVLLRHLTVQESSDLGEIKTDRERGQAGMLRAILDWNLDDLNGDKAPITSDWLGRMPQGDFKRLSEAFQELEGIVADAKFPGGAGVSGGDGGGGAASAAAIPATASAVGATGPAS